MRTKTELSVGEWAVLALVCERPMHGYSIAAAMAPDGEIGRIWSLGQPLVYRALRVLQSLELIEVSGITPGDRAPRRTELVATTRARRMVTRWLSAPVPRPRDGRSHLLLKICFLRRRGRSLVPLLQAERDVLGARVRALEVELEREQEPLAFVVRWRLLSAEAAIRFVEETLAAEAGRSAAAGGSR